MCWIDAVPPVTDAGEPTFVPSTLNCTVPPPGLGATVADSVTASPFVAVDGADTVVVVSSSTGVGSLTVTVLAVDVDPPKPVDPEKTAVTWWAPAEANVCWIEALPAVTAFGAPTASPSTLNCTVPPSGVGDTDADSVTASPAVAVPGAVTVVVVSMSIGVGSETVTVFADDVEPLKPDAPENTAVT